MSTVYQQSGDLGLLPTVRRTLATYQMLAPGDRVLIGVSGGPDSMALLFLFTRLAPDYDIQLGVAHLNHCLRGVSGDRDAELVRQTAESLNIPFHLGYARVKKVKQKLKLSLEEAARRVRYAFFNKTMLTSGYNKLAVGHHMDDNAEQMLLALFRGTGPRGLSGIAPVNKNGVIRPLIHTSRRQIETFNDSEGIISVKDTSNDDPMFFRNRVRNHLLPLLAAEFNPQISCHLNRLADVTRTEEVWIEKIVATAYDKARCDAPKGVIHLSIDMLRSTPLALTRRLIRMALENLSGDLRRITFSHIQSAIDLVAGNSGEKTIHLPGGLHVRRSGHRLIFQRTTKPARITAKQEKQKEALPVTTIPHPLPPAVEIQQWGIGLRFTFHRPDQLPKWTTVSPSQAFFDLATLTFPLTLRPPAPGDRFTPLGTAGTQKIKKYFIDHHVPRYIRTGTAILTDQQRIIWLVGQRMDDHTKVTAETSDVLGVEFFLLDI